MANQDRARRDSAVTSGAKGTQVTTVRGELEHREGLLLLDDENPSP
jgi:hypothetical protein